MNEDIYNPFTLKGRNVLVTGASSGIGQGIAIACSQAGASVILNGRNETRLAETIALMKEGEHRIVAADLTDALSVKDAVSMLPNLDGIVHCAGIGQRIPCRELREDDIDEVMNTNFKAPVMLQAEILRQKKMNREGSIVFIASIAAESPSMGNAVYSASKGAIISYANCLGIELAPRHIRVNCISPAMVRTGLIFKGAVTEEALKADEARYPLKRYGTPKDIAYLTVYMLSEASAWMTGSNVKITGGANSLINNGLY